MPLETPIGFTSDMPSFDRNFTIVKKNVQKMMEKSITKEC